MIRGERRIKRDPSGFDVVEEPVSIGLSFLPKDALNFNGSTGGHLDVSSSSIMPPEDQYAVCPCLEIKHKIDEMFRVVEMKFQLRNGSPDSNGFLMILAGGPKKVRYGDNFHKSFIFKRLQKPWGMRIASEQWA